MARAFLSLGNAMLKASAERNYEPLLCRGHPSSQLLRELFFGYDWEYWARSLSVMLPASVSL